MEAVLDRVSEAEAVEWLNASQAQLQLAKAASELLFSQLTSAPGLRSSSCKVHGKELLTQRFDTEQIWQQIDLQAAPLVSTLRRRLKRLESASPDCFFLAQTYVDRQPETPESEAEPESRALPSELERHGDVLANGADFPSSAGRQHQDHPSRPLRPSEDLFLKLGEMEEFLNQAEDEDEGVDHRGVGLGAKDTDDEMDDVVDFSAALEDEDDQDEGQEAKYKDFFSGGRRVGKRKVDDLEVSGDDTGEEDEDEEAEDEDKHTGQLSAEENGADRRMSSHEKRTAKLRQRMGQLEQANIDQKDWTLQGEVTAAKRPKNSALEVELDFEQRAMPAPVITEEVTKSIEDIIRSRILTGDFDDVERKLAPATRASKEQFEIDEAKSKKGLGEIYETEYLQTKGFVSAAKSSLEQQKEEVKTAFKALCLKLDALSHFHFTPKPVVQEMGVRADVPALVMEEVAPVAVAEASLLAPEEIFAGKGAIVGKEELSRENRKSARARKKRNRKLALKSALPSSAPSGQSAGRHPKNLKPSSGSSFGKSAKVFEGLSKVKEGNKNALDNASLKPSVKPKFKL